LEKALEHEMRVLISSTSLPATFVILKGFQRNIIINLYRSSRKMFVILLRF